jgi:integrase/recombinase XerD
MGRDQQLAMFTPEGQMSPHLPLSKAIPAFQLYLHREGKTANTIKGFSSDLHLLCQYFEDDRPLSNIRTSDLNRFLDWLENGRGQTCSRKSYARRVTTLKVFFKWLEIANIRSDNPAKSILQRSGPAPLQTILAHHDLKLLLDYVHQLRSASPKPDSRPDVLVRLLLQTGIKKNECMELTLGRINRQNPQQPTVTVRHRNRQNIYKDRHLPISADWLPALDEYLAQYKIKDVLFPCTARNLEYVLHDVASYAGVEGRVSFELLRWTSAVKDYLGGMDMDDLREKLGLSPISWRETSDKIIKIAQQQVARS